MNLSYLEKQEKLNIRIRAHKEFANFDISEWMDRFLGNKERKDILDVGCGNGNHLGLYLRHVGPNGCVTGLDRESTLIAEARENHRDATNLYLEVASMDDPLPFEDQTFDTCFSVFAIYNAAKPEQLISELIRVMKPGAELVLIGPTRNNAGELYDYNERLTGEAIDPITLLRTDRLRQEILPIANRMFPKVETEVLHSFLTFPDKEEFIRYFMATMLYEEGAEKKGVTIDDMVSACLLDKKLVLSKEMLAVVAVNGSHC